MKEPANQFQMVDGSWMFKQSTNESIEAMTNCLLSAVSMAALWRWQLGVGSHEIKSWNR